MKTEFVIAGRTIDIRPHIPFRGLTWRALRKINVDPLQLARLAKRDELEMAMLEKIALAAFRLADPSVTEDQMLTDLTFSDISSAAAAVLQAEAIGELDRPTSTGSSSSPSDGDGGPTR